MSCDYTVVLSLSFSNVSNFSMKQTSQLLPHPSSTLILNKGSKHSDHFRF
jgi:hypothetical protein